MSSVLIGVLGGVLGGVLVGAKDLTRQRQRSVAALKMGVDRGNVSPSKGRSAKNGRGFADAPARGDGSCPI